MYAVIETGGKQYRVTEGDEITIEKLKAEVNSKVEFDKVLLIENGGEIKVGTPYLDAARVTGSVLENGKGKKVIIFKYKAKKDFRKKRGHRQPYTLVQIDSISADGVAKAEKPLRQKEEIPADKESKKTATAIEAVEAPETRDEATAVNTADQATANATDQAAAKAANEPAEKVADTMATKEPDKAAAEKKPAAKKAAATEKSETHTPEAEKKAPVRKTAAEKKQAAEKTEDGKSETVKKPAAKKTATADKPEAEKKAAVRKTATEKKPATEKTDDGKSETVKKPATKKAATASKPKAATDEEKPADKQTDKPENE